MRYRKKEFPVDEVRRYLEPGPIVLVSSAWKEERDVMTMGWHTIMGFEPSLIGCYIWNENFSYDLIRKSEECVIHIPTMEMAKTVVDIGNCSGKEIDKFEEFGLTVREGKKVNAPVIEECYADFECRLYDGGWIKKYNFFVFEVVYAEAAKTPKFPKTIHYRGEGQFMISGENTSRFRKLFRPDYL